MMDHLPAIGAFFKNIRGQHGCGNRLPFDQAGDILVERHAGQSVADFDRHIAEHKLDRRAILKNPAPALDDCSPAPENLPTRVAALNVICFCPYPFHCRQIEPFESPIKTFVGTGNFLLDSFHHPAQ